MEHLKNRVEHVDIENYEPDRAEYEIREVQIVADRFEESMERNKRLIQHVFEEELLRKDAELEILRNQITPHFIYNSLQLIKAEAVMSGNREIGRSVNALAGLLRYSMDSRTDTVHLAEELDYIDHFLEIYKKRYVDRFTYEIISEEQLGEYLIPKMIFQPLVENSIRHGFSEVRHGGRIKIEVDYREGFLLVRIEDNGCGVSTERLLELRKGIENPSEHAGREIGLLNVHRRIRLQCGEESGIEEIGNITGGGFFQQIRIRPISV
jgi:two-component system sensor histidine kinase YesM